MNDLTLLRALRSAEPDPDDATLESALHALRRSIERAPTARRRRTRPQHMARRIRWGVLVAAGTIAITAALVLTDVLGVAGLRGGATAGAAELLDHAATATIRTADPVLRADQYRRVIFTSVHDTEVDGDTANSSALILIHEDRTTWIPANPHKPWVQVRYPERSAGWFGGAEGERAARRDDALFKHTRPQVLRGVNGDFFGGSTGATPASVAALPRDPRMLLNHIYRVTVGTGNSADGEALVFIADTLNTGFADADVRAALYRAAALIPGVTVTDGGTTLNGRQGVAIGRTEGADGVRQELIVDTTDGSLIGERDVLTRRLGDEPAGTVMEWTSATTTVVDDVPAAYRG
jgi:hypothetical protein